MKRKLIDLVLVLLIAGVAAATAQDVSVRADHPEEYTVVRGDTLWDISAKFLEHPWQWPAIWHANQQIENPHLIYPGDKLSLVYLDGQPRLVVDRGKPVTKLSPTARATNRAPITAINHDDIAGFIRNVRMVSPEEYEGLPYVIANEDGRTLITEPNHAYVRGVSGNVGDRYAVVRLANIYYTRKGEKRRAVEPGYGQHAPTRVEYHPGFWEAAANHPANRGPVIGYELFEVSEARVLKTGDPAIVELVTGLDAVTEGDVLVPVDSIGYPDHYMPHAMDAVPEGLEVLAVQGDNYIVGHYKVVSISGGSNQGVELGHVFSAFRPGDRIRDSVKYPAGSLADASTWNGDKVTLPEEFDAHIMVFRVFDEISYALVMQGRREVRENDILRHPSETL